MKQNNDSVPAGKVPWVLLYLLEFTGGMTFSALGSMLPDISEIFALSVAQAASLPFGQFLGGFCGLIILGLIISRAKPKVILTAAAFLMTVSTLCISIIHKYSFGFVSTFFLAGTAMSIQFALPGVITTFLAGGSAARNMNIVYSFMSAGVVFSPLAAGVFITYGFHYPAIFIIISSVSLVTAVITLLISFPSTDLGPGFSRPVLRDLFTNHRLFVIVVLAAGMCYMSAEAVPNNWIPKYLTDNFSGYTGFRPGLILALFWASVTVGRYICAAVLNFWNKPRALLIILSICASACLLTAPSVTDPFLTELIFISSGLFFSGMIPIIFSFNEHLPRRLSGTMFILILAVGMLGASGAGKSIGLIADAAGFRAAIMIGAVPLFIIFLLVFVIKKSITS